MYVWQKLPAGRKVTHHGQKFYSLSLLSSLLLPCNVLKREVLKMQFPQQSLKWNRLLLASFKWNGPCTESDPVHSMVSSDRQHCSKVPPIGVFCYLPSKSPSHGVIRKQTWDLVFLHAQQVPCHSSHSPSYTPTSFCTHRPSNEQQRENRILAVWQIAKACIGMKRRDLLWLEIDCTLRFWSSWAAQRY